MIRVKGRTINRAEIREGRIGERKRKQQRSARATEERREIRNGVGRRRPVVARSGARGAYVAAEPGEVITDYLNRS